ncbi:hypothetical protein D3C76_1191110 [compost metagenome]
MSRIRSNSFNLFSAAIERQRIKSVAFHPEFLLEQLRQLLSFGDKIAGPGDHFVIVRIRLHRAEKLRNRRLSLIDITLHFGESNWSLRIFSVAMHYGIGRVLPPLIRNTFGGFFVICHKAAFIQIAACVDPFQRPPDVGHHLFKQLYIVGPFNIFTDQDQKQWRRVNRTIIRCKRHLVRICELAIA